jgi:hypothetical protein
MEKENTKQNKIRFTAKKHADKQKKKFYVPG